MEGELRALIAAVEGQVREPTGRSFHIHQLDGDRLEAMVYLEPAGVRIDWLHGRGDCAITGAGGTIMALLRGTVAVDSEAVRRDLVLYGDLDLVRRAPEVFSAP